MRVQYILKIKTNLVEYFLFVSRKCTCFSFYKVTLYFISATSCLPFKMKFLKIHPTLPIYYMFKMLLRTKAFFLHNKILNNFNILENSQKNWPKSQPGCLFFGLFIKKTCKFYSVLPISICFQIYIGFLLDNGKYFGQKFLL